MKCKNAERDGREGKRGTEMDGWSQEGKEKEQGRERKRNKMEGG